MENFKHKRVAIDFDGTLFEDCGNIDISYQENKPLIPIKDANDVTHWLKENGFEILIFTCRPDYHRKYMENLLNNNNIIFDYILFYTKPRVDLYIDDKGFRFKNWKDTKKWLINKIHPSQEPNTDFESVLRKNKIQPLGDLKKYRSILDIGCGSGDVFDKLSSLPLIDAIEPDNYLQKQAKQKNIYNNIYNSSHEVSIEKYDLITILGVLEHIQDEKSFLEQFKNANQIYITVPNASSFHRLIGKEEGIIQSVYELNDNDIEIGHQRYYDKSNLYEVIEKYLIIPHKFKLQSFGTTSLKFGTNDQMKEFIKMQKSFETIGKQFNICGENCFNGAELYIHIKK